MRSNTIFSSRGQISKSVILVRYYAVWTSCRYQPVFIIVAISPSIIAFCFGDQVAVVIIAVRGIAHLFILIHFVDGVVGSHTIHDFLDPIAHCIINVAYAFIRQTVGNKFGLRELSGDIIAVSPIAIQAGHGFSFIQFIIAIAKARQNGIVCRIVDELS